MVYLPLFTIKNQPSMSGQYTIDGWHWDRYSPEDESDIGFQKIHHDSDMGFGRYDTSLEAKSLVLFWNSDLGI